jgi:hypothetical protein
MTPETAESLMKVYARLGETLNEATGVIALEPDVEEQKRLRRHLAQVMSALWFELQLPIVKDYPHLDPDGGEFR